MNRDQATPPDDRGYEMYGWGLLGFVGIAVALLTAALLVVVG